jgi:hypothetical protein
MSPRLIVAVAATTRASSSGTAAQHDADEPELMTLPMGSPKASSPRQASATSLAVISSTRDGRDNVPSRATFPDAVAS